MAEKAPIITGIQAPALLVTRVETILTQLLKAKTFDELREQEAALKGMRLFRPTEAEIGTLNEFARFRAISERANTSRFVVESYKVLIQRIVSRSVKEELSREQSLYSRLLTGLVPQSTER